MRFAVILLSTLVAACAANPERAATASAEVEAPAMPAEASPAPVDPPDGSVEAPVAESKPAVPAPATLPCQVDTAQPAVRKHLRLDEMGPTGSYASLPRDKGFLRFGQGDAIHVSYICATWSADSDDCEGSAVQVVELATLDGNSTKVVWQTAPRFGSGNLACKNGGNLYTFLDLKDYDGDGAPDVLYGEPSPRQSTIRLFNGVRYRATAVAQNNAESCRPNQALQFSTASVGSPDFRPAKEVPAAVEAALIEGYLHAAAECPAVAQPATR